MKKPFFFKTFYIALLAVLIAQPTLLFAASYSVTPLVLDRELEKRDIVTETVTLTNHDGRIVRIYPTVNEIAVDVGGKIENFVEASMVEDRATSITSWLEISRGRIELKPGESKEITLTIRVNPEVAAGEYHAFIGFPEGSNRPDAEKKVMEGNVPGTVVRVGIDKIQNQFLRLSRFSVEKFVKETSGGDVQYSLNNPGDDPVVPKGEIIFYDNNGVEVSALPVNPEGAVIEGGSQMDFTSAVPDDMKMGKYKAFLSVEYGEHQTASVHDTAFFYVLPLWNLAIIFAVVLAVAIALALYIHRRYDLADVDADADDVAMYIREGRSESKEHDIDLSQKK